MLRLKELREEKGWNMRQAAANIGIPYTTYVSYEKGQREPNSEMLVLLSEYYGVSIDYLIGISERKKSPATQSDEAETNPIDERREYANSLFAGLSPEDQELALIFLKKLSQSQ